MTLRLRPPRAKARRIFGAGKVPKVTETSPKFVLFCKLEFKNIYDDDARTDFFEKVINGLNLSKSCLIYDEENPEGLKILEAHFK
ncbi:hypothetical protein RCL_jg21195.t1 [Rhizophagus clarus]|uniref:Uncharacterized protein n=1 Tax=Rhizophagus clarus TaxID=94130 RepID=A0A8H3LR95_9GLOM|nr:hypothetical protein RCL_jg21195.t1 [Rhizophagus clarus]